MIVHDVVQGSREWWALRLAIPTASRFGQIITPAQLKPSRGRFNLIADLMVEKLLGKPSDFTELDDDMVSGVSADGTPWMRRGSELEEEAARWYVAHRASSGERADVREIGFVTNDERTIGASPDRAVGDDGGLEIKCRSATYHMRIVLGFDEIADRTQVQGTLWLTGWKWIDQIAYNPDLPKRIDRAYPDPRFFRAFEQAWAVFRKDFAAAEKALAGITEDCVEDDNLKALLAASLQKETTEADGALDLDSLDALREDMERAGSLGLWSDDDTLAVVQDIEAGEWESVREMAKYLRRLLETEATPA